MDNVYRPEIGTPFSSSIFDDFQMEGSTATNSIIVDDEEDKENSAPTKTTPESERPTNPPPPPPDYWEVVHLGLDWKMCLSPYTGLCFVKLCIWYIVCVLNIEVDERFFH